jgi:hypothetical protein|tara:strand:+ start:1457 stop:1591 length:135 start_codon:yes stop_codon:yes gene_type:complete
LRLVVQMRVRARNLKKPARASRRAPRPAIANTATKGEAMRVFEG